MCIHRFSCTILVDTFFLVRVNIVHNIQHFYWKPLHQKAVYWLLQDTQQLLVGSLIRQHLFSAIYLQFRGTQSRKRLWIELLGGSLLLLRAHNILPLPSCLDSLNQIHNSTGVLFVLGACLYQNSGKYIKRHVTSIARPSLTSAASHMSVLTSWHRLPGRPYLTYIAISSQLLLTSLLGFQGQIIPDFLSLT